MTKFWKRWIPGPTPSSGLTVGAIYRQSDAGEFATWTDGDWITVPGDSIGPLTTEGDPMIDRMLIDRMPIERLQQIMVDADLGRVPEGYTPDELAFRDRMDADIQAARARGEALAFTSELP